MSQTKIKQKQVSGGLDGWIPIGDFGNYTFTASGSEVSSGTNQFLVSWNDSMSLLSYVNAGMKIKWTQNGTVRYGIIHYADADAGTSYTEMQIFGGSDYDVLDTSTYPVSNIYISRDKSPFGFPISPSKWEIVVKDTTLRTTSATSGTWYNLGSLSIPVPIGSWKLSFVVASRHIYASGSSTAQLFTALSTSTSSATNSSLECWNASGDLGNVTCNFHANDQVNVSSATVYYLIIKGVFAGTNTLRFENGESACVIRAENAYL